MIQNRMYGLFCHDISCMPRHILERTGSSCAVEPHANDERSWRRCSWCCCSWAVWQAAYEHLEMKRFVKRHRLDAFHFNPHFPINTLNLMRGAVAAQRQVCFEPYVDAIFAAMWERGLKMDDPAVIEGALVAAGLDAQRLMQATQDPEVKAALLANTQAANDRGAFGAPTFFLGDQMWFGKDRLGEVEEAMLQMQRGRPA